MNKAILNRKIQVLENSLKELTKAHNQIINDINKKVRCEECRKVMIQHAKEKEKEWQSLYKNILGAFAPTKY